MRSIGVVVGPPFFDGVSRFVEVSEQVFVETLVAQSPLKPLHKPTLHRFARRHEMPLDSPFLLQCQDGI